MSVKKRVKAIDRFIAGCKTDGIYDDLNAACIMAGWDSLAGALTPMKGAAPTASNITVYDRCTGAVFNGTSSTIDLNRAVSSDDKDDCHYSAYHASFGATKTSVLLSHVNATTTGAISLVARGDQDPPYLNGRFRSTVGAALYASSGAAGFVGASRSSADGATYRWNDDSEYLEVASVSGSLGNYRIGQYYSNYSSGDVAFYSAGSATDLSLLKARVSTLMSDLRSIEESDFDADALTYIRAVEEADGAYLETDVKVAINKLVAGLKFDSLWDSIGASCLLCGPRTLAGALVPLKGDAPTSYGFVEGDFDRVGLTGDFTSYLDSNASGGAYDDENHHWSVFLTSGSSISRAPFGYITNTLTGQPNYSYSFLFADATNNMLAYYIGATTFYSGAGAATGLAGMSANNDGTFTSRIAGINKQSAATSQTLYPANYYVFARNNVPGAAAITDATIAFYSIGTSLDLALLDTHISNYVTAIGAAL